MLMPGRKGDDGEERRNMVMRRIQKWTNKKINQTRTTWATNYINKQIIKYFFCGCVFSYNPETNGWISPNSAHSFFGYRGIFLAIGMSNTPCRNTAKKSYEICSKYITQRRNITQYLHFYKPIEAISGLIPSSYVTTSHNAGTPYISHDQNVAQPP